MFFIPIRAFWVAVIDMGLMAYEFMRPTTSTLNRGSIIAYLVNFFIFYLIMGRGVGMRSSNSKAAAKRRKRDYDRRVENLSRQVTERQTGVTRHSRWDIHRTSRSTNVQSVEERSGMAMIWSFGSAQNVTEIMSIVTNIYLRMSM